MTDVHEVTTGDWSESMHWATLEGSLSTDLSVFVECVPDVDLRPVSGDRRVSNYQELPAHEFIVREYGNGWEKLDVRTDDSVDELEERVREMNHFAPEEDHYKPARG